MIPATSISEPAASKKLTVNIAEESGSPSGLVTFRPGQATCGASSSYGMPSTRYSARRRRSTTAGSWAIANTTMITTYGA